MLSNKLALNTNKSNYIVFHEQGWSALLQQYSLAIGNVDKDKVSDTEF